MKFRWVTILWRYQSPSITYACTMPRAPGSHVVTCMENNYRLGITMLTVILVYLALIIRMTVSFPLSFLLALYGVKHGYLKRRTFSDGLKFVRSRYNNVRRIPESFLAVRTYGQISKYNMLISWVQNTWPGQCKVLIRETTKQRWNLKSVFVAWRKVVSRLRELVMHGMLHMSGHP